jgi:hypothetical protein
VWPVGAQLNPISKADCDDDLVAAIERTQGLCLEFASVANCAAEFNHRDACLIVTEHLHLVGRMRLQSSHIPSDFLGFLQQELFVILISALLKNERWEILNSIFSSRHTNEAGNVVSWTSFNNYIGTLDEHRKKRLGLNRISVARDLYSERHSNGSELARVVPVEEMEDADWYLTFVTGFLPTPGKPDFDKWLPRISIGIERVPDWLGKMRSRGYANAVLSTFDMPIDNLSKRREMFERHFKAIAEMNAKVWISGVPPTFTEYYPKVLDQLFAIP